MRYYVFGRLHAARASRNFLNSFGYHVLRTISERIMYNTHHVYTHVLYVVIVLTTVYYYYHSHVFLHREDGKKSKYNIVRYVYAE